MSGHVTVVIQHKQQCVPEPGAGPSAGTDPAPLDDRAMDLAAEINEAHEAAEATSHHVLAHAKRCGALLIEAKALVPDDRWLDWLATHTRVSARVARTYMRFSIRLSGERPQEVPGWSEAPEPATDQAAIRRAMAAVEQELLRWSQQRQLSAEDAGEDPHGDDEPESGRQFAHLLIAWREAEPDARRHFQKWLEYSGEIRVCDGRVILDD